MGKRRWFCSILVLLLLCACEGGGGKGPKVIHHPPPDLTVNVKAFLEAGCTADELGVLECETDSPLASLECDRLQEPSDFLGGLDPAYPLAVCRIEPFGRDGFWELMDTGEYLYREGCMAPVLIHYVAYRNAQFQVIRTQEQFRSIYAPIETADEALSYALAVTGYSARYGLEVDPDLTYFVDVLEDTHVVETRDGFSVHLYFYELCGCGPHRTVAVDLLVTPTGEIENVETEAAFKDPQEDGMCID